MYKYETHLHTFPVSKCAKAGVRESLEFYKAKGYDGVFITNHFIGSNINTDRSMPYLKQLEFFFTDYDEGLKIGKEIGLNVFLGVEMSYEGTDFLIYGLDKNWYFENPGLMEMPIKERLNFLMENGALVVHAHPFREADYIPHINLFPGNVQGVEIINACRTDFENKMAGIYAANYDKLELAGSDNHIGQELKTLAGMCSDKPVLDEKEFVELVKNKKMNTFFEEN